MSNQSNRIIIITIPHGFCTYRAIGYPDRNCDLRAYESAHKLYEKLVKKGVYPLLFPSIIEREEHDLNRPWSREVSWRRSLEHTLQKLRKLGNDRIIILVDMHSFIGPIRRPDLHPEEDFRDKKMGLLDFDGLNKYTGGLLQNLQKALGETNIVFVPGSEVNDIQLTSRKYVNYSFLIENNEDSSKYTEDDLDKAMETIATYLLTFEPPTFQGSVAGSANNSCILF